MSRKLLFIFSTVLLYCCNSGRDGLEFKTMNAGSLKNKDFFISVPYEFSSDSAAVVEVLIKGRKCRFMIDTGAPLAISRSLQADLNFPVLINTINKDANGDTASVQIINVNDLSFAGLSFTNIPAVVLDFRAPVFSCDHIDGLIGSNILRLLIIQFDKTGRKIQLGDHIDSFSIAGGTVITRMSINNSQSDPVIGLKLNADQVDSLLYDSGDKSLYSPSQKQVADYKEKRDLKYKIAAEGKGVSSQGIVGGNTNDFSATLIYLDSISVGGKSIKNVYAELNPDNRSRLGRGLLDYGIVTLDYLNGKFYFLPNDNTVASPPRQFGFEWQERDNKLLVSLVWKGTLAHSAGLQPGYQIMQFGNFIPSGVSKCEWAEKCADEAKASGILIKYIDSSGSLKTSLFKKISFNIEATIN